MANVHLKKGWMLPERMVTPEQVYLTRRKAISALGLSVIGGGVFGGLFSPGQAEAAPTSRFEATYSALPRLNAPRNPAYQVSDPLTPMSIVGKFNNFYEFSREKDDVWLKTENFTTRPWTLEVSGEVKRPKTFDMDDLIKRMPLEERVYRFRCVEAWSMTVPWVGFPFSALLKAVEPTSRAKFVKFTTFMRPSEAPRQGRKPWFGQPEPFPYTEGLSMAEAMNELTLITVGIYGRALPKQNGAPIRLIVPWKYGYKNIKSVVKIELTERQPATFWNLLGPREYGFVSNVNPRVPHPRWSQAFERDIGTRRRKPTLLYNGYAEQVGGLYKG